MNRGLSIQIASLIIGTVLIGQAFGEGPELVLNITGAEYVDSVNKWYAPINSPLIFDLSNSIPTSQETWFIHYAWGFGDSHWYHEADYVDYSYIPPEGVWYKEGDCAFERCTVGDFPEKAPIGGYIDGKHGHMYTQTGQYQVALAVTEYDPVNGVPGDSTTEVITIVIVDVSISGGVDPTTLIAVNDDDDNNNLVVDCAMSEFSVTGEDDLVAISAGLSPAAYCSGVGYIRLSIVNLGGYLEEELFLWSTATKSNRYLPCGRLNDIFHREWQPQSLPSQPMYVEAVSTAGSMRCVQIQYYVNDTLLVSKMAGFTIN